MDLPERQKKDFYHLVVEVKEDHLFLGLLVFLFFGLQVYPKTIKINRNINPYLQILENSSRNRGVSQSVFLENSSIEILWIPIQLKVKFGV